MTTRTKRRTVARIDLHLSDPDHRALLRLSSTLKTHRSKVIRRALRELAQREGVA